MRTACSISLAFLATLGLAEQHLSAQGKGHVPQRNLGALSRAGAQAASQAAPGLSRASERVKLGELGRGGAGLQRAASGASHAGLPRPQISGSERVSASQQRILEHRLGQADHLRALSEKNGNQHLLDTADRMEANARANAARHGIVIQQNPLPTTTAPEGITEPSTAAAESSSTSLSPGLRLRTAEQAMPQKRGFWLKSR